MSPRQQAPIEVEYNSLGYLLLPHEVARQHFPNDSLVLMIKGDEVWMLPTRGAAAGGLLLKQRNPSGDRSVLAAPYLPTGTAPGRWIGFWDERSGALRVAFRLPAVADPLPSLEPAIAAQCSIEHEQGRWVVYLELGFSSPDSPDIRIERRRIADYPSEQRARVAASWMERTADRDLKRPNLGS